MAIEEKSKEINGVTYHVVLMDGVRALNTQLKLIKILGPGASRMLGLKNFTLGNIRNTLESLDSSKVADILQPLIDNFDDKVVHEFILSLFAKGVFVDKPTVEGPFVRQPLNILTDFKGKPFDIWAVARFILEVNLSMGE